MEINEKRKFISRLSNVRAQILKKYPFFGNMVMNLSFGVDETAGTAYTDMKHIIFDPAFVDRIGDAELEFVLMHEVMHCVLKHCVRGRGLVSTLYNIACDIVVNSNILAYMELDEIVIDGEYAMHSTPSGKEGRDYTAEEIYADLLSSSDMVILVFDEDGNVRSSTIDELNTIDSHDNWQNMEIDSNVADMWDKRLDEYGLKNGYGHMNLPQSVRKIYENSKQEKELKWKELLRRFVDSYIDITDYSFAPPDRRFNESEFFLPGENTYQELNGTQNIWFCIDTSGSISKEELTKLFNEVKNVIQECPGMQGLLSFFDTSITPPVSFEEDRDFEEIKPTGGGGTSFHVIFRYMKENMMLNKPKAIVILTDGYAENVPEELAEGVPVMWILINNSETKPWGETIHIKV